MKRIQNKKLALKKSVISMYQLYGGQHGNTGDTPTVTTSSAYHDPTEAPVPSNQTNPQFNSLDPLLCN